MNSRLSERSKKVALDGQASDPVPILSGVPQGSVLCPSPFSYFHRITTGHAEDELERFKIA